MRYFPIFLDLANARVVVGGGGEAALAKLRLLLKTEARIEVFAPDPAPALAALAEAGRITLHRRSIAAGDAAGAKLAYAAQDDAGADARAAALARADGALVNVVDTPEACAFLTPALVDRDPVVVAIGTEGAAPVLARRIKSDLEARLPARLGALARIARSFRALAAHLPGGSRRRAFWVDFFSETGPRTIDQGEQATVRAIGALLDQHLAQAPRPGRVDIAGAGPGDPELLTLRTRRLLDTADIVIHDRLVSPDILELARREARLIAVGKEGFGPSVAQQDIHRLMIDHARTGAHVLRLKGGDPGIFGRLDEELEALNAAGVDHAVHPGLTAASAAVASIGQSLTRRDRNAAVRLLTGHDTHGFTDHDWRALARPGEVAAVYMGKRASRFLQGRLLMHGADPATPVTVVENASRADERVLATTLGDLEPVLTDARLSGPAVILLGLAPRPAHRHDTDVAPTLHRHEMEAF